jgi:hypothetical protein
MVCFWMQLVMAIARGQPEHSAIQPPKASSSGGHDNWIMCCAAAAQAGAAEGGGPASTVTDGAGGVVVDGLDGVHIESNPANRTAFTDKPASSLAG